MTTFEPNPSQTTYQIEIGHSTDRSSFGLKSDLGTLIGCCRSAPADVRRASPSGDGASIADRHLLARPQQVFAQLPLVPLLPLAHRLLAMRLLCEVSPVFFLVSLLVIPVYKVLVTKTQETILNTRFSRSLLTDLISLHLISVSS